MLLTFSPDRLELFNSPDVDAVLEKVDRTCNSWLRCIQSCDRGIVAQIIQFFGLKASRTDMITNRFPSGVDEDMSDCLFNNYEVLSHHTKHRTLETLKGSLILGANFLLTFETYELITLNTLIDNILKRRIDIQERDADYLLYLVYRETLNNYYGVFDRISRRLDELEDKVLDELGDTSTYNEIAALRQSTRLGRRNLQTIKYLLAVAENEKSSWISSSVATLLSQVLTNDLDSLLQEYQMLRAWMSELMEIQRDNVASKTSQRLDRLTVLSFIFLPITFIAGVYGMNFEHMPELKYPWAYPAVLGVMLLIVIGMITYAKHQRWL